MKIAIIGASGFIGLRTSENLVSHPDLRIVPLVRAYSSLAVLARRQYPEGWKVTSFVDVPQLAEAIRGCDACVHAAIGDANTIPLMADAAYQACAQSGVKRLVWLSSASVHGQNPEPGTNENTPLHDKHPLIYNNAKVRAEWILKRLQRDERVEVVRLRPSVVFGPRSRWITDVASSLIEKRAVWLNNGEAICNSIYVDNLVDACLAACRSQSAANKAFLVGDAEKIKWRDFLIPIALHLGYTEQDFFNSEPPTYLPETESFWSSLTMSKPYGSLSSKIPYRAKRIIKAVKQAWPLPEKRNAYRMESRSVPTLSHESSLLQECEWQLPNARAYEELGYSPSVSFNQGINESLEWLSYIDMKNQ